MSDYPEVGKRDHCLNCGGEIVVVMGLERPHWFHVADGPFGRVYCPPRTSAEPTPDPPRMNGETAVATSNVSGHNLNVLRQEER